MVLRRTVMGLAVVAGSAAIALAPAVPASAHPAKHHKHHKPSTSHKTTTTTAAKGTTTACLFGTWTVGAGEPLAGTTWTIHTNGSIGVSYAGELSGTATYTTTLPADPQGSSGSYVATPTSQDVAEAGHTIQLTAHDTTWTCQGNSLTLVISGSSIQLSRTAS